jgi:hypothetical protein
MLQNYCEDVTCPKRGKIATFCKFKGAKRAYFSGDRGLKEHISLKIEG